MFYILVTESPLLQVDQVLPLTQDQLRLANKALKQPIFPETDWESVYEIVYLIWLTVREELESGH